MYQTREGKYCDNIQVQHEAKSNYEETLYKLNPKLLSEARKSETQMTQKRKPGSQNIIISEVSEAFLTSDEPEVRNIELNGDTDLDHSPINLSGQNSRLDVRHNLGFG